MSEQSYDHLGNIEDLFRIHHKKLCYVARRIVNNKEIAEDIVQEVFLNLWKKKSDLKIESTSAGYLHKATVNAALNYLERDKTLNVVHEEIQDNLPVIAGEQFHPEEIEERMHKALAGLPPKCRAIFILSREEGMKYQEIADHLSISIKTVENQMGIALEKLRQALKPYF